MSDPTGSQRTLAESATKLQKASEEMAVNMDELSESLSQVADGFAQVSETTKNPAQARTSAQIDPNTAHSSGFGAADD